LVVLFGVAVVVDVVVFRHWTVLPDIRQRLEGL
jgi:hypothetical protein